MNSFKADAAMSLLICSGRPSIVFSGFVLFFIWSVLTVFNIYQLHNMRNESNDLPAKIFTGEPAFKQPVVWIPEKRMGNLHHVTAVFESVGYITRNISSQWDILWSHNFPFDIYPELINLKPHQKVNHFPGSFYIGYKRALATTKMKFIPTAFRLPEDKDSFHKYASEHPNTTWIQKSNGHRGIEIKDIQDIEVQQSGVFVQEYVTRPFLIDGRKFDIGVYAILTSIDPIRLYMITGETLFRFCKTKYYPIDYRIIEKYAITDVYLNTWEMPSLKKLFEEMNYSFFNTVNAHLHSRGVNYRKIWDDIKSAITAVYLDKEPELIKATRNYKTNRNFFEMMRFDFVIDEDLNVFLMEANMSPNLSSKTKLHRMHGHAIFNLFSLVGIIQLTNNNFYTSPTEELEMQVSNKDISVFPEVCTSSLCHGDCTEIHCKLCNKCLTTEWRIQLKLTYLEHVRRGSCRRLFPEPMNQSEAIKFTPEKEPRKLQGLSEKNQLITLWFMGKCRQDIAFCT